MCVCVWLLLARTPQNQQGLLSLELLGHKSQVNVAQAEKEEEGCLLLRHTCYLGTNVA